MLLYLVYIVLSLFSSVESPEHPSPTVTITTCPEYTCAATRRRITRKWIWPILYIFNMLHSKMDMIVRKTYYTPEKSEALFSTSQFTLREYYEEKGSKRNTRKNESGKIRGILPHQPIYIKKMDHSVAEVSFYHSSYTRI